MANKPKTVCGAYEPVELKQRFFPREHTVVTFQREAAKWIEPRSSLLDSAIGQFSNALVQRCSMNATTALIAYTKFMCLLSGSRSEYDYDNEN